MEPWSRGVAVPGRLEKQVYILKFDGSHSRVLLGTDFGAEEIEDKSFLFVADNNSWEMLLDLLVLLGKQTSCRQNLRRILSENF